LKKKDWMCDLRLLQLSAAATMRGRRRNAAVTITMKFVRGKRNYVPHFLYLDSPFSIDFLITFVKLLHYELSNEEDKSINQSNKQTKNP